MGLIRGIPLPMKTPGGRLSLGRASRPSTKEEITICGRTLLTVECALLRDYRCSNRPLPEITRKAILHYDVIMSRDCCRPRFQSAPLSRREGPPNSSSLVALTLAYFPRTTVKHNFLGMSRPKRSPYAGEGEDCLVDLWGEPKGK